MHPLLTLRETPRMYSMFVCQTTTVTPTVAGAVVGQASGNFTGDDLVNVFGGHISCGVM